MNNITYTRTKQVKLIYLIPWKSMKNSKTSGNDGSTKEFDKTFCSELKTLLMKSNNQAFHTKIVTISQRQAAVKLNEINVT